MMPFDETALCGCDPQARSPAKEARRSLHRGRDRLRGRVRFMLRQLSQDTYVRKMPAVMY